MLSSSLCDQINEVPNKQRKRKREKEKKKRRKREKRESVFQISIKKERKSKRTKEQRTIISDLLFNTLDQCFSTWVLRNLQAPPKYSWVSPNIRTFCCCYLSTLKSMFSKKVQTF